MRLMTAQQEEGDGSKKGIGKKRGNQIEDSKSGEWSVSQCPRQRG
jgi:hypothetical protein